MHTHNAHLAGLEKELQDIDGEKQSGLMKNRSRVDLQHMINTLHALGSS
jgi:hypothetical protein